MSQRNSRKLRALRGPLRWNTPATFSWQLCVSTGTQELNAEHSRRTGRHVALAGKSAES